MDFSSIASMAAAEEASQIEAMYAVKLIKAAQESEKVIGSIIEDTVEISKEAMEKFLKEI